MLIIECQVHISSFKILCRSVEVYFLEVILLFVANLNVPVIVEWPPS